MASDYGRDLLRLSIGQICQTIGYNATQTTPLELLQDILDKFLHEFCRDMRRSVEHYNRNEANLNDVCLTISRLKVTLYELIEYLLNVEPATFAIDVPKYPLCKDSNLNFLKPGSREVLLRPVHIYEHLPPILPPDDFINDTFRIARNFVLQGSSGSFRRTDDACIGRTIELKSDINQAHIDESILQLELKENSNLKYSKGDKISTIFKSNAKPRLLDEEGRATREIESVMMTTGGFISPAIEGKLPHRRIPDIIEYVHGLDAPMQPHLLHNLTKMCSSSLTSAAIPLQSFSDIAAAKVNSKLRCQGKTISMFNLKSESSVSSQNPLLIQTQKDMIISSAGISSLNSSSSALAVSNNTRLAKKHASVKQAFISPPLAARILKKAKKKSALNSFATATKLCRSSYSNYSQDSVSNAAELTDKAQRKRMRLLQKLVNSAKNPSNEMQSSNPSFGKLKNLHGLFNTTLFDTIPSHSKRLQMEKILKRKDKPKHKLLRSQITLQIDDKPIKKFYMQKHQCQQQQLNQQQPQQQEFQNQTESVLEYSKVCSSEMEMSSMKFSKMIPGLVHIEEKNIKAPVNTSPCTQSRKLRKNSLPVTQSIPNTLSESRGINSMKTHNKASTVFNETPFSYEQASKNLTNVRMSEIKLCTEPDRNKLNIFKKISAKQKMSKTLSPSTNLTGSQSFSRNDNVINLPSGTTITPAPPSSRQHVYSPDDSSLSVDRSKILCDVKNPELNVITISEKSFYYKKSLLPESGSANSLYKPKKRGRKPGSKNQAKLTNFSNLSRDSQKKTKKLLLQKTPFAPTFNLQPDNRSEPLNLSYSLDSRADMKSNNLLDIKSTHQIYDQQALVLDTSERMKLEKDASIPIEKICERAPEKLREPSKKNIVLPSKEEVDSINRKLLKMDTVLQADPPLQQIPSVKVFTHSVSKEKSSSPTINIFSTPPRGAYRYELPKLELAKKSDGTFDISGSPLQVAMQSPSKNFPNLPQTTLPILPMYSFSPRPGLIPTQGVFPPVLGKFSNKQLNPAAILQGIMSFPAIRQPSGRILHYPDMNFTDKFENEASLGTSKADRNYCNVAPLVPESFKPKLSSPISATSLISPKHKSFVETPKTPQLYQSPTISETTRECIQQNFSGISTPESRSLGSKSIPSTPGGISLNTFDCLIRGSDISTTFSAPNNLTAVPDTSKSKALSQRSENTKNIFNIPSLNEDSPIEVSDDSEEASTSAMITKDVDLSSCKERVLLKSHFGPTSLSNNMDDMFVPFDMTRNTGSNQSLLLSGRNKDVKKNKKYKQNKFSDDRKHSASFEFCISRIENDGGVGKLAGGADLIPLSGSGLAYSSKSTPSNSLISSSASTSFDVGNLEFASNEVRRDDLSVMTSSNLHDKRKKLKKLKYGKLKKKKDKKNKGKNKEKYYEKIQKHSRDKASDKRHDKVFKKMKKEKRREKQRFSKEPVCTPTLVVAPSLNLASACFDVNVMNLSNLPPFSGSTTKINATNSSSIPKLTLKLGNYMPPIAIDEINRKQVHNPLSGTAISTTTRESSPELARISPLVTRPPKQKTSIDSLIHFNVMSGVGSSGIHSHGSLMSSDLFGDKNRNNNNIKHNMPKSQIQIAPSSWSTGGTLTASSTLLPQQLLQTSISHHIHEKSPIFTTSSCSIPSTTQCSSNTQDSTLVQETIRPSSYIDTEGNRIWICPACGKIDDGSAMIGCDGCDAWYHWVCVGIFVAPKANEDWYCRVCISKKKSIHGAEKKRKRNKKK